jgi:hypothetical protein
MRHFSPNYFCREKAISIKYSECGSVALVIQHKMRMRRTILPCVTRLAVPYFTTLCHKWNGFLKKDIDYKIMCFDFIYIFVQNIPILITNERDIVVHVQTSLTFRHRASYI